MKNHSLGFLAALAFVFLTSGCNRFQTGPITANYLMAFYSCNSSQSSQRCDTSTEYHSTYLGQSDDGLSWGIVPGWTSVPGSTPGIVKRGTELYIYNDGGRGYRLDLNSNEITNLLPVTLLREDGSQEYYSAPRAYLNADNRIVLFYVAGNNVGDDPEDCDTATCLQVIRSATEVGGSEGTEFIVDSGERYSWTINNGESGGFPTIYRELSRFILLLSYNNTSLLLAENDLTGSYAETISGAVLTTQGGFPSGIYQSTTDEYWTFVSYENLDGTHKLQRAKHSSIQAPIGVAQWTDVATANDFGLGEGYDLLSPVVIDNRAP